MGIFATIKNLFKVAKLLSVNDTGALRFATVSMLGKTQKMLLFTPYGLMSNPPPNSMAILWAQQAQESNLIGLADDPANRVLKNLAPGEVALGNYWTGNFIHFDETGLCTLDVDALKIVSANDIEIEGANITITATGAMSLNASTVGIVASSVTHGGVNIGSTHKHSQGNDSDGDTEQDTGTPHS